MATWTPIGGASRSVQATQLLTEAAPTLASDGVDLTGDESLVPVLHAPGGQTFTGTGSLLGYVYTGSQWVRAPRGDYDMSDASGLADVALPAFPAGSRRGRFMLVPSAVAVSGAGTTMTTEYFCTLRANPGIAA